MHIKPRTVYVQIKIIHIVLNSPFRKNPWTSPNQPQPNQRLENLTFA